MSAEASPQKENASTIPADDLKRVAKKTASENGQHIGIVGDTYTILVSGKDTAGRFCLIDMFVPPSGGPPPHRHDFEETFSLLEGELEFTFRGNKQSLRAGESVNIPANAPHQFHNASNQPARMLCICSPAGQEEFFAEVGIQVADPNNSSAQTRRGSTISVQKESRGTRAEISHGVIAAGLIAVRYKSDRFP